MQQDLRFVDYFLYTQHSVATFEKCPLKFKKRYLENLKWDSIPDEVVKKNLQMGNDFHMLANRYFLGIDTGVENIEHFSEDDEDMIELGKWIENLKDYFEMEPNYLYLPEHKLRLTNDKIKIEANLDLIIIKDNSLEIWDWKTRGETPGSKVKRDVNRYKDSLQTKVYLFVLKELSNIITPNEIPCENIKMIYWQPDPMEELITIEYSEEMHSNNKLLIEERIKEISNYNYNCEFDKTLYKKHCKICEFNWFCNNEKMDLDSAREEFLIDELDFDDIEELF